MHLAYCLNVHPGETWDDALKSIQEKTLAVKKAISPDRSFGLGLRVSNQASLELSDPRRLEEAKNFFNEHQLYAFTINGFPYGKFHQTSVKENVYKPDWQTAERRDYTMRLAKILAVLLPDGVDGSISTVPVSFKPWITNESALDRVRAMLMDCVNDLDKLYKSTGRLIHLGLEPEPCCYLETTDEFIGFFKNLLASNVKHEEMIRLHLGVCLDTCHVAMQFEDVMSVWDRYEKEGIRISKIQLSAALELAATPEAFSSLRSFAEPVYLHQVKAKTKDGHIRSWIDIPAVFEDVEHIETLRVHFHVPLFWQGDGVLRSTVDGLTDAFWRRLAKAEKHVEMETYTFDVLPAALKAEKLEMSVVREYHWLLDKL